MSLNSGVRTVEIVWLPKVESKKTGSFAIRPRCRVPARSLKVFLAKRNPHPFRFLLYSSLSIKTTALLRQVIYCRASFASTISTLSL